VLDEAVAELREGETAVLGITNQRSTVILWDGETGAPLGPALSWRDSRAQAEAEALANSVSDLAARTGLPSSPHYGAPKITWALEHWPEARRAADAGRLRIGPVGTWLAWKLTQGESFVVDPTNAQRMHLLDLGSLDWHPDLVEACSLPLSALPQVLPTDGHFGTARAGGRELPIRAMLGDQQAALLGLRGDAEPEPVAGVHLGTGGFVLRDTGAEARLVPGLLGGLARADANRPRRYLCEGPVNSAGSAFDRLRELGLLGAAESVDEACARASRPLTVLPAWAGLAAPWWQATARAAMSGWDESTTTADIVAGTVHGVAFLVADVVDRLREHEVAVERLELSGPVSAVDALGQAIADACVMPTAVRTNPEASLEGIALLAGAAEGLDPIELTIERGHEFAPATDLAEERAAFTRLRELAIADAR
jgi:glycerol kinase